MQCKTPEGAKDRYGSCHVGQQHDNITIGEGQDCTLLATYLWWITYTGDLKYFGFHFPFLVIFVSKMGFQ